MRNGTITKITPEQNNTYFTVTGTYTDNEEATFTARKIVLGTGLKDLIPDTPGLRENWGKGIYWCPWCDGHEHADQALGLIGPLSSVPGTVKEILTVNRDIIAFVNGTDTTANREATEKANPRWQEYLELHGVQVENRTIASIERLADGSDASADASLSTHPEHDLFRVHFTDGNSVTRAAFLTSFGNEQYSKVGEEAGVQLYGTKLGVDPTKGLVTSVPGIYAVGDCNSDNSTNVPHALYSGKRTAVYLHGEQRRHLLKIERSSC
jgi:thioredoxin reductase